MRIMFFNENYMTDMERENRNRFIEYSLLCVVSLIIVFVSGCVEDGISLEKFSVTARNFYFPEGTGNIIGFRLAL